MDDEALAALISGAQRGDAVAFERLIERFADRVFGFFYRMTGSRTDAEDLMQEVFVRVVRMIGSYKHDGRFEAWLFRIAANLGRDRIRRVRRGLCRAPTAARPGADFSEAVDAAFDDLAADGEAVDANLVRSEDLDALQIALSRLPPAEREVIMLRHFSQMSFKQIAEVTGTPLGTALARAHRALGRLREMMSEQQAGQPAERRTSPVS